MGKLERNNTVEYYLDSAQLGLVLIQEPKGWADDIESFERDPESLYISSKIENDLEFHGNGYDILTTLYNSFGVVKCNLLKFELAKDDANEKRVLKYYQRIDLTTLKTDEKHKFATVKAVEGGLWDDIKKRQDEEYDLFNNLTETGVNIGDLKTVELVPSQRGIFRQSLLEGSKSNFRINSHRYSNSLSVVDRAFPLRVVYNSEPDDVVTPLSGDDTFDTVRPHNVGYDVGDEQSIGDFFYYRSEIDQTLEIRFETNFSVRELKTEDGFFNPRIIVELRVAENVNNIDKMKSKEVLMDFNPQTDINQNKSINIRRTLDLKEDDSVSIVIVQVVTLNAGAFQGTTYLDTYFNIRKCVLTIENSTDYQVEAVKAVKAIEWLDRIMAKMTDKVGMVKSTLFDKENLLSTGGEFSNLLLNNGFMARGFPRERTDAGTGESRFIQLNTSWKTAIESLSYIYPLTWFPKVEPDGEKIYVEDARITMQLFNSIDLGEASNLTTEAMGSESFRKITIGMEKEMDYEEINGLDEPNGKVMLNTYRKYSNGEYMAVTKYRIDPVGYELTRRKSYDKYPNEDTLRDDDIWMHDCKKIGSRYYHKTWEDDFDSEPKGVFKPETVWNLKFAPVFRLRYGHGYAVNTGLYHEPDEYIGNYTSNCNPNLELEYDGNTLKEKAPFKVSELDNPLVIPRKIVAEVQLDDAKMNQVKGFTTVDYDDNSLSLSNLFGIIKITYRGEDYYGRIIKLQNDNDKSTVEMIEIFR